VIVLSSQLRFPVFSLVEEVARRSVQKLLRKEAASLDLTGPERVEASRWSCQKEVEVCCAQVVQRASVQLKLISPRVEGESRLSWQLQWWVEYIQQEMLFEHAVVAESKLEEAYPSQPSYSPIVSQQDHKRTRFLLQVSRE